MQLLKTVPLGAVTPILCFLIICTCLFIVSPYWAWLEKNMKNEKEMKHVPLNI